MGADTPIVWAFHAQRTQTKIEIFLRETVDLAESDKMFLSPDLILSLLPCKTPFTHCCNPESD